MIESSDVTRRRTAHLVLRRPGEADVDWIAAMHADPRNYTHSPDGPQPPVRARGQALSGIENWERDGIGYWLAEHEGEPIGMVGITTMTFCDRPCWNLYYRFVEAARGRGFGAEATREALAVAAALDAGRPVVVRTRPANVAARRLAETIGLRRREDLDTFDGFVVYVSAW